MVQSQRQQTCPTQYRRRGYLFSVVIGEKAWVWSARPCLPCVMQLMADGCVHFLIQVFTILSLSPQVTVTIHAVFSTTSSDPDSFLCLNNLHFFYFYPFISPFSPFLLASSDPGFPGTSCCKYEYYLNASACLWEIKQHFILHTHTVCTESVFLQYVNLPNMWTHLVKDRQKIHIYRVNSSCLFD